VGDRDRADLIEIQWLGGGQRRLENVAADQGLRIVEKKQLLTNE
jgi:hypothetical protein